ncbi:Glycerol-3-phosphate regulon repressor [Vibrio cholerae]|nr:Glycerol-3-phosphate regulon repressor [Vibrio cholerae]
MKAVKRHQEIIELVQAQGFVSTEELVERFDVSPQTIRRDLNELAEANKLRRNDCHQFGELLLSHAASFLPK